MAVHVRTIDPAETRQWFETLMTAFQERWDMRVVEDVQSLWDYGRVWAAIENGAIVGTTRSWATRLTMPGGAQLPGSAIAAVGVLPTHRRRGILRAMLPVELAAARVRGEAVAVLHASEYPIYGRFGFGPAVPAATWTVTTRQARLPGTARPEAVRAVEPSEAVRDVVKGIFDAWRAAQPGEIWRRDFTWDDELGLRASRFGERWKGFLVVHHDDSGTPDGYARYRVDGKWERGQPHGSLQLDELHALDIEAYADLWRFLMDLDWVASIRAERRAPHERLPWLLTNARAAQSSEVGDGLWLAILDTPRVLAARSYERSARLVIETVSDAASSPDATTRVLLDAAPDGSTCAPTDDTPDLTVHAGALGAACLGGVRLRDAVLTRGADEHTPGALAMADALLRTSELPWCSTFF